MSRFHSHINSAKAILESYKGDQPFSAHIKSFFSSNKKYGSGDRKKISHYCYVFFRVRQLFPDEAVEQVILKGLFLTSHEIFDDFPLEWKVKNENSTERKLEFFGRQAEGVFPFLSEVSPGIDKHEFALSILEQPSLFLRVRPGKKEKLMQSLLVAGLAPVSCGENCLSFPNGTKLDKLLRLDQDAVVQDLSSQRVLDELDTHGFSGTLDVWDCCAGSGGKTILLYDSLRDKSRLRITVTDIRESILKNLRERMSKSGVPLFRCLLKDLSISVPFVERFSIIICDVPCSGSGTWGRTPEQIAFFTKSKLEEYAQKQKIIAGNAIACLHRGGLFFYITCSVFEQENESVVSFLQKKHSLQLLHEKYHKGYGKKADTLYVAVLSY